MNHLIVGRCFMSEFALVPNFEHASLMYKYSGSILCDSNISKCVMFSWISFTGYRTQGPHRYLNAATLNQYNPQLIVYYRVRKAQFLCLRNENVAVFVFDRIIRDSPTANLCTTSLWSIDAQKPNYYNVFLYFLVLAL